MGLASLGCDPGVDSNSLFNHDPAKTESALADYACQLQDGRSGRWRR